MTSHFIETVAQRGKAFIQTHTASRPVQCRSRYSVSQSRGSPLCVTDTMKEGKEGSSGQNLFWTSESYLLKFSGPALSRTLCSDGDVLYLLPNTAGNWASLVAKGRKNPLEMQEMQENRSPSREVPPEESMATYLSILASRIP